MKTLHLGVVVQNYANAPPVDAKRRRPKRSAGQTTTGDVAEILEAKYHIMRIFWELHGQEVADDLGMSLSAALESIMAGAPLSLDTFGSGTGKLDSRFRKFLESKEMDSLGYPGIPTKASLMGVDLRRKNKKGTPGRPSFIASTLYENSFKSWID